jgi:hypothetical protein
VVGFGVFLLVALPLVPALALACVALVLRLCEWSWEKRAGSMGSTGLLLAAGVLCLPLVVCLLWAAVTSAL